MVSKERLLNAAWADTAVGDDVLIRAISELRRLFEDDPKQPRIIETIPKAGYRLIAPVTRPRVSRAAARADGPRVVVPRQDGGDCSGVHHVADWHCRHPLAAAAGGGEELSAFATTPGAADGVPRPRDVADVLA